MIMYSYLCSLLSSLLWSHIITIRIFVRLGLDTPHSGLDLPSLWPRSPFILASIFPHYGVGPLTTKTHPIKVNAQPIQNKGPPYQHEGLTHQKQNPNQFNFFHSGFDLPPIRHKCPARQNRCQGHQKQMPDPSKIDAHRIGKVGPSHQE